MGLLREWRKFGIRDLVVDRERGRVWARVGAVNCMFLFSFHSFPRRPENRVANTNTKHSPPHPPAIVCSRAFYCATQRP